MRENDKMDFELLNHDRWFLEPVQHQAGGDVGGRPKQVRKELGIRRDKGRKEGEKGKR